MSDSMELVRSYLLDLDVSINSENADDTLFIISDEDRGIHNLIIDCEEPIVVIEQYLIPLTADNGAAYKRLLQMNQYLVHGAFVLDDEGRKVLFRDTLQLANLDSNELEASIDALALALAEFGGELLDMADSE